MKLKLAIFAFPAVSVRLVERRDQIPAAEIVKPVLPAKKAGAKVILDASGEALVEKLAGEVV